MKRHFVRVIASIALIGGLCVGTAWAAAYTDLSARELKSKMDGADGVLVINPLSDLEFNEGHIPGSVNIPFHLIATSDQLPADKDAPIVTYCLGPKCVFYKQTADLLTDLGYTNVMTFKAGIPGWIKAGYPIEQSGALEKAKIPTMRADELKGMLGQVVVLDIRPPKLYEMGWIPGSVKIPLGLISTEYQRIPKGKPVVVVDHAGKQVITAGRFIITKGYTDVKRLEGGLMAWSMKGYPLEK